MNNVYDLRIILFVDILGFTSRVKKSEYSLPDFNSLKTTLEYIQSLFNLSAVPQSDLELLQFSDSLVISIDASAPGGVLYMIQNASFAMHAFFANGYICKGAIHVGRMHHSKEILFGPGFLDVMRIEALEDRPLIKFSHELLELATTFPTPAQKGYENVELEYIMEHAEQLGNNTYQIDWSKDYGTLVGPGPEEVKLHYQTIKQLIEQNIKQASSIRVLKKYLYLKRIFNNSLYLKNSFPEGITTVQGRDFYRRKATRHISDSVISWLTKLYWKKK